MSGLLRLRPTDARWLAFVESRREAMPFHHVGWLQAIVDSYDLAGFVLALEGPGGAISAGMPVVEQRAPWGRRRRWLSLPYTDSCAPLGDEEAVAELVDAAEEARVAAGAGRLEIRSPARGRVLHPLVRGYTHTLDLTNHASPEQLWGTLSASRVHRGVRRARRDGVVIRTGGSADDLTKVFYGLHLLTRRRQGVPIQPRRFFEALWRHLISEGVGTTYVAELRGHSVAAAVFLTWNGTTVYKFGASDPRALGARPNHALFWYAIEAAFAAGQLRMDFGRTDVGNEGLRSFKSQWGAVERRLVYATSDANPRAEAQTGAGVVGAVIRSSPPWVCRMLGERLYRYVS